ncbi:hypothetical protein GQ600_13094 [Phytophthora cactorum]|nr:hypothetical protein GQ600_13094 [Phytophthora cactorum]
MDVILEFWNSGLRYTPATDSSRFEVAWDPMVVLFRLGVTRVELSRSSAPPLKSSLILPYTVEQTDGPRGLVPVHAHQLQRRRPPALSTLLRQVGVTLRPE